MNGGSNDAPKNAPSEKVTPRESSAEQIILASTDSTRVLPIGPIGPDGTRAAVPVDIETVLKEWQRRKKNQNGYILGAMRALKGIRQDVASRWGSVTQFEMQSQLDLAAELLDRAYKE